MSTRNATSNTSSIKETISRAFFGVYLVMTWKFPRSASCDELCRPFPGDRVQERTPYPPGLLPYWQRIGDGGVHPLGGRDAGDNGQPPPWLCTSCYLGSRRGASGPLRWPRRSTGYTRRSEWYI
eukprot:1163749-Pyramimonas_sp.AAC.1